MNALHKLTIVESLDFAQMSKENIRNKQAEIDNLSQLDWSLSLLIQLTGFGFDELIKQYEQAQRLNCAETEEKCKSILLEKFPTSFRDYNESDFSSADGSDLR